MHSGGVVSDDGFGLCWLHLSIMVLTSSIANWISSSVAVCTHGMGFSDFFLGLREKRIGGPMGVEDGGLVGESMCMEVIV